MKWTMDTLAWASWLDAVALDQATPEQLAVLEESHASAKTSPYYLTLVHDVEALRQRSRLFNAAMYAPRGLSRADRELASLAESRVNGCVYCASVHAARFAQLSREPAVAQAMLDEGVGVTLDPRRRVIVDFAVALSATPAGATPAHMAALRAQGLTDLEILDLIHAVAMFAWANRLMQTLGEPELPA